MLAETVNSRAFILLNFEHPMWGAVCAEWLTFIVSDSERVPRYHAVQWWGRASAGPLWKGSVAAPAHHEGGDKWNSSRLNLYPESYQYFVKGASHGSRKASTGA